MPVCILLYTFRLLQLRSVNCLNKDLSICLCLSVCLSIWLRVSATVDVEFLSLICQFTIGDVSQLRSQRDSSRSSIPIRFRRIN